MTAHPFTVEEAARRVWNIRRLWREHAIDWIAAANHLEMITDHPNARLRKLAESTRAAIVRAPMPVVIHPGDMA